MITVNKNNKKSKQSNNYRAYLANSSSNPTIAGATQNSIDENSKRFREQESQQNIQNELNYLQDKLQPFWDAGGDTLKEVYQRLKKTKAKISEFLMGLPLSLSNSIRIIFFLAVSEK